MKMKLEKKRSIFCLAVGNVLQTLRRSICFLNDTSSGILFHLKPILVLNRHQYTSLAEIEFISSY